MQSIQKNAVVNSGLITKGMDADLRTGASNFSYSGFEDMLSDEDRHFKYRKAIQMAVQRKLDEGEEVHVLDIGSGTGLLSLYAAKAGAALVTAVELDPIIFEVSKKIAKRAGLDDRIRFINAESTELDDLPRKANILIFEIFDSELLGENVLRSIRHALEFLTTDRVVCIPERAEVFVVPIESQLLAQQTRLSEQFQPNCQGNLNAIESHWLTSGRKTLKTGSKLLKMGSFIFNDINSLNFQDTVKMEFTISSDIKQVDGILFWWDLDLVGDGSLVISTGGDENTPRWRNHWLQCCYGFPNGIKTGDRLSVYASHDEVSFWFCLRDSEHKKCTCGWHSTISPNTFLRFNNIYRVSPFVKAAIEESFNQTVLCVGSHSMLPILLKAKKIILIEEDDRFCSRILASCSTEIEFVRNAQQVDSWGEINLVIFDIHSNESSSPIEFVDTYRSIATFHKDIRILPAKMELKTVPMKFDNLWRRRLRVKQIDEFDYSDFDVCFQKNEQTTDEELELLPLWEERCYTNGFESTVLSFNSVDDDVKQSEIQIPRNTDAFVFWFSSTQNSLAYNSFKRLNDQIVEWDKGTRQWIYFITEAESTTLKIDFKDGVNYPRFALSVKR